MAKLKDMDINDIIAAALFACLGLLILSAAGVCVAIAYSIFTGGYGG